MASLVARHRAMKPEELELMFFLCSARGTGGFQKQASTMFRLLGRNMKMKKKLFHQSLILSLKQQLPSESSHPSLWSFTGDVTKCFDISAWIFSNCRSSRVSNSSLSSLLSARNQEAAHPPALFTMLPCVRSREAPSLPSGK